MATIRGSSFSGIRGQVGSTVGSMFGPIFGSAQFSALQLAVRTTAATYPAAPTDLGTPTTDTAFLVLYGTGQYAIWAYDVSATKWIIWEGAPVA